MDFQNRSPELVKDSNQGVKIRELYPKDLPLWVSHYPLMGVEDVHTEMLKRLKEEPKKMETLRRRLSKYAEEAALAIEQKDWKTLARVMTDNQNIVTQLRKELGIKDPSPKDTVIINELKRLKIPAKLAGSAGAVIMLSEKKPIFSKKLIYLNVSEPVKVKPGRGVNLLPSPIL